MGAGPWSEWSEDDRTIPAAEDRSDSATNAGAGNMAVRLNHLDLTRGAEQTAIIMSLLVGRGIAAEALDSGEGSPGLYVPRPRRLAYSSLLGYLYDSYCDGRIIHAYAYDRDKLPGLDKRFGRARMDPPQAEWTLDFAISPVDGLRDLLRGYDGGVVSVLAAGPRGAFPPAESLDKEYLVLAPNPCWLKSRVSMPSSVSMTGARRPLEEVIKDERLILRVWDASRKSGDELVLGTMEEDQHPDMDHALRAQTRRLRSFHGSAVLAALEAYCPEYGLDAFAALVPPAQAVMIAAAAKATNAEMYAFPVVRKGRDKKSKRFVESGKEILSADHFVKADDVFLIATGITESHVLQGVRFRGPGRVSTQTICLRSGTQSRRYFIHHHDLTRERFRILKPNASEPEMVGYSNLVGVMEGQLQSH